MKGPAMQAGWARKSEGDDPLMHLAQVLAHRLRGLITSIEGFADLLTDTLGTREQRELLLRIFEGTSRIEQVLADLQLYSQPIHPIKQILSLAEVAGDLMMVLEDDALARVALHVPDEQGTLEADPQLLRQALLVLIQNGLDAVPPDGSVHVRIRTSEDQVLFEIWNDGVIPLQNAEERVFIPFFTTKAHNLGVGLSIARQIAQVHDGRLILAHNAEPKGTCFTLVLPFLVERQRRRSGT